MPPTWLHTRLPLDPSEPPGPTPAPSERPRLGAYLDAIKAGNADVPLRTEEPDPLGLAELHTVPAVLRLRLLDRLYATFRPTDTERLERFINAYAFLARSGFSSLPFPSRGRRNLARSCAHALELMQAQFRGYWRRHLMPPTRWWGRFLATFRATGSAQLFSVRCPTLEGRGGTTPLHPAARTLLQATANPFAWEPELQPYLETMLDLLSRDVLLFPATSPSAYVEGGRGRFVFDAAGDHPPALPDGQDPRGLFPDDHTPKWWIIDASRALARVSELRRGLALGASPERLHPGLADIPRSTRQILLQRLERILGRDPRRRRTRLAKPRRVSLAVGLEQAVRHSFAGRWTPNRDPASLQANVRLQSEPRTHPPYPADPGTWEAIEWEETGLRLRGTRTDSLRLVGQPVLIMDSAAPSSEGPAAPMRAGLIRWQQGSPNGERTEAGVELLPGSLHDGWFRISWRMGTSLQEQPVLLLTGSKVPPSLLMPAGLFRAGTAFTIRIDDQDRLGEMIRLLEMGIHFEHVQVRLEDAP
ncbi:hypothetical protein [Thiohalorhabdus denitrificans]|uniref:Uncharacterized protein n=1 Tax=Thiohalorhabdus denitrificans TaxID=381306 RepID=A0A1G5H8R4_9GAMM|nr:hypothetical protein [Thiohalorhabdus denitrificans]SCY60173.1 hypothetical protein SAMN05661077_2635 [Thiohalorhabdus denitrificans]